MHLSTLNLMLFSDRGNINADYNSLIIASLHPRMSVCKIPRVMLLPIFFHYFFLMFPSGQKNPERVTEFVETEIQSLNLDRHKPINFIEKLPRIALQRWWEAEITSLDAAPKAGSSFKNAGPNVTPTKTHQKLKAVLNEISLLKLISEWIQ